MYFTAHGRALPCCMAPFSARGYDSYTLGDATQQTLREIWNGAAYQDFRAALLSDTPPRPCAGCGLRWSLCSCERVHCARGCACMNARRGRHPDPERGGDDRRCDRIALPRDVVDEIIVADSSSRDGTAAIARAAGARVVTLTERGYGRACAAGAAAAGERCGIILFLDGDGADRADLADMLVAPIRAGTHDFVIGSRVRGEREPGSMSWHQVLAGRLAGWLDVGAVRRPLHRHVRLPRDPPRCAGSARHARDDLWLEHRDADEGGTRRPAHPGTAGAVPPPRRRQFEGCRFARRQRPRRLAHHR